MNYQIQEQLINQLSQQLDDFLPSSQTPSSNWIYNQDPIQILEKSFYLSYLTLYPNENQSLLEISGKGIIDPEQSSPINLPRLIKSESSILGMFGIKKAFTLHPCIENQIVSLFDAEYTLLNNNMSQQLLQIFQIAARKSNLSLNFPFLVFTGSSELVQVKGRVNDLVLTGCFNSDNISIKFGINKGNAFLGNKMLAKMLNDRSTGINSKVGIKIVNFGKQDHIDNLILSQQNSDNELEKSISSVSNMSLFNINKVSDNNTFSLINLITVLKQVKAYKKPQIFQLLNRDNKGNYEYQELLDANTPLNKINSYFISLQLSHYLNIPLFRLSNKPNTQNQTIPQCWNVYNHLPANSKKRGAAVESIICHEFSEVIFDQNKVINTRDNLFLLFSDLYSSAIHDEANTSYNQLEDLYYRQLKDLMENIDELQLVVSEIPTSMSIIAIQNITHFGTAAIGSFEDQTLDLDEAMIWAFNFIVSAAVDPTLIYRHKIVIQQFEQLEEIDLEEQPKLLLRDFVNRTKFLINLNQFEQIEPDIINIYNIGRNCPLGCPLCRLGQILQRLDKKYVNGFVKYMLGEFQKANAVCQQMFDVYVDSILYQKLWQLYQIKQDLQQQIFIPYIPKTIDQVQNTYQIYSKHKNNFIYLSRQSFFMQINYLMILHLKQYDLSNLDFFNHFFKSCQNQIKGEAINYDDHKLNIPPQYQKYQISENLPTFTLLYPFSNDFVINYILTYLDDIIQYSESSTLIINDLQQALQVDRKQNFMQNQEFFESQVNKKYVAIFCSQQALIWGYSRCIRKLNQYQNIYKNDLKITDLPVSELNNYLKMGQLNLDLSLSMKSIKRILLLYENIHFVSKYYDLDYITAYSLLTSITPLDANVRQIFKNQFNFSFSSWELVLSCVSPEQGKYYRFYSQYLSGYTDRNNFSLSFEQPIGFGVVDTL
ncbi:hypothetical protein SS50377_22179 [Spironucleus salmonicida]|uniref:Uncharacterized protein n=1 Tax=Spironucleus salmonicida TaxID=348837 RepID=V6LLZ1_9EUKA|nr:hypothetical protein SS50377_22179 [Spironucleus salmonicida]|eukprot:EST45660.1 hypothetical protein SS50377_14232 [Spironucleus salmonicida]